MNKRNNMGQWLAVLALGGAFAANAAPLFSSPPAATLGGEQSDDSTGAFDTTFTTPAGTVDAIAWWGFHGVNSMGPSFDSFQLELDGMARTGSLSSSTDASGLVRYVLDVADFALASGTSALSLVNASPDVEWFWQYGDGVSGRMAFELLAADPPNGVPEPASIALVLAAGLAAVAARRGAQRR